MTTEPSRTLVSICRDCVTVAANGTAAEPSPEWTGFLEWVVGILTPSVGGCSDRCGSCPTCRAAEEEASWGYFATTVCDTCGSGLFGGRWDYVLIHAE